MLELLAAVAALSLGVSFLSGLLGIGGGILMGPLLLYLPPLWGLGEFSVHEVTGLTMVQGLVASTSGVLRHRRYGFVSPPLVKYMGGAIAATALAGAVVSSYVPATQLLALFALMAAVAAALMVMPAPDSSGTAEDMDVQAVPRKSVGVAASVGLIGGMVGQGGAFILVPLMIQVLRIPTRITIGSSLGIVLFSALAGFVGKAGTGQIPLAAAIALAIGAIPGAQMGSFVSKRTRVRLLRHILAGVIAVAAVRMWIQVLGIA